MPRFESQHFRVRLEMHVFAPHGASEYVGAAIDVAREILEGVRWLKAIYRVRDNGQCFFGGYLGCSAEISRAKKYDNYEQF